MAAWLDGVKFNPTLGGTTDFVVSTNVIGFMTPATANAVNARVYKWHAESADLSQWEDFEGAYTVGTTTVARTTVLYNSSGTGTLQSGAGTKISFSTVPTVSCVALKEDMISIEEANAFTAAQKKQAQQNIYVAPTRTVLTSGSGTYTLPTGCQWIEVEMVGGGGGGGGSGAAGAATTGFAAGNTTFGSALLTANGGTGASATNATQSTGGTASGGDVNLNGANGGAPSNVGSAMYGGFGGNSLLGVFGLPGIGSNTGGAASGYGAGGGGAGASSTPPNSGGGGAAGGYLRKIITSPSATYLYTVGVKGTGGNAGTGGAIGGDGSPGIIIVTEHYGS